MIYSMTGYASAARELPGARLNLELRSVNHRYLDVQFRMPDDLRVLEPALRDRIAARVQRGKLECRVGLNAVDGGRGAEISAEAVDRLRGLSARLRAAWPAVPELTAAEILQWPGVLTADTLSPDDLRDACFAALDTVLGEFTATRAREGDKLAAILRERVAAMRGRMATVAPRLPQILASHHDKLRARLREVMDGGEDERVRQEVALLATRVDVDEELSRLEAHCVEVERVLAAGGAAGKRLDFLMQELNREANTLGSKAADIGVTQVALDLKLLIEQMREQIQNIE